MMKGSLKAAFTSPFVSPGVTSGALGSAGAVRCLMSGADVGWPPRGGGEEA